MTTQKISLNDRFDLEKSPVLLNGTQALVRLMMMQSARDRAAGPLGELAVAPRCLAPHPALGQLAGAAAARLAQAPAAGEALN